MFLLDAQWVCLEPRGSIKANAQFEVRENFFSLGQISRDLRVSVSQAPRGVVHSDHLGILQRRIICPPLQWSWILVALCSLLFSSCTKSLLSLPMLSVFECLLSPWAQHRGYFGIISLVIHKRFDMGMQWSLLALKLYET